MLSCYLLALGIALALVGAVEVVFPLRAFAFWLRWSSSKYFFLHGILLIAGGFPLTLYAGPLSGIIFAMGLLACLTGPFVLLYPEKFRMMFASASDEMKEAGIRAMVRIEGGVRIAAGTLCAAAYILK
jgi:hypothetical protein